MIWNMSDGLTIIRTFCPLSKMQSRGAYQQFDNQRALLTLRKLLSLVVSETCQTTWTPRVLGRCLQQHCVGLALFDVCCYVYVEYIVLCYFVILGMYCATKDT